VACCRGDFLDSARYLSVGSGTTILAADKFGRPCYAAEMSPAIAAVCLERLAAVGKRPRVKESSR
jgi:hypothetical protein